MEILKKSAVVKNQRMKQREQSLGDCWQWKANGKCSEGDDMNKRAKSTQQNVNNASRTKSPRGRSPKWENGSIAVQGLPQRKLHHSIL